MSNDTPRCKLCGEPMPPGEEMFKYHGYSGACPKPPLPRQKPIQSATELVLQSNLENAEQRAKDWQLECAGLRRALSAAQEQLREAMERERNTEKESLRAMAAVVRAAGGTVRVRVKDMAQQTGTLIRNDDLETDSIVFTAASNDEAAQVPEPATVGTGPLAPRENGTSKPVTTPASASSPGQAAAARGRARGEDMRKAAGWDAPAVPEGLQRPHITRRIANLRAIADDRTVNNFARSVCAEAASYLEELAATNARMPIYGAGAIVCKKGGMGAPR